MIKPKISLFLLFLLSCLFIIQLSGCIKKDRSIDHLMRSLTPTNNTISEIKQLSSPSEMNESTQTPYLKPTEKELELIINQDVDETVIPTEDTNEISTPLDGIQILELEDIVSNPFDFSGNGKEEGHHGTDFSFYRYKSFQTIESIPILSMFPGRVSSIVSDRPPYGNMMIIETPLSYFQDETQSFLLDYLPVDPLPFKTDLSCPDLKDAKYEIQSTEISLYSLYAHLKEAPIFTISDFVQTGDQIGQVGNSGASGNPHLHLEYRLGRSGIDFPEMSHYINSASPSEIYNYCLWRISGYFFQIDPMKVIGFYLQNR